MRLVVLRRPRQAWLPSAARAAAVAEIRLLPKVADAKTRLPAEPMKHKLCMPAKGRPQVGNFCPSCAARAVQTPCEFIAHR